MSAFILFTCKCKNARVNKEIVIADYWRINKVLMRYNDNKVISLVLINSSKALSTITQIDNENTEYKVCLERNGGFLD